MLFVIYIAEVLRREHEIKMLELCPPLGPGQKNKISVGIVIGGPPEEIKVLEDPPPLRKITDI